MLNNTELLAFKQKEFHISWRIYIPEKERYVKNRKKRQRQHAADKVLALGAFGNETFIAIYGSLVFITLIIAVFNDLQLF